MGERSVTVAGQDLFFDTTSEFARTRIETFWTKEPATLDWIDRFRRGAVFYDVGANVGLYSLYAAAKGHQVIAFEPLPENYATLCRNIVRNGLEGHVVPLALPLAARTGLGGLAVADQRAGTSGSQFGDRGLRMPGVALSDAVRVFGLPMPDYVKIDVDGLEADILHGGRAVLRACEGLSVEVDDRDPQKARVPAIMADLGFESVGAFPSPLSAHGHIANVHFVRKEAAQAA